MYHHQQQHEFSAKSIGRRRVGGSKWASMVLGHEWEEKEVEGNPKAYPDLNEKFK